MITYSYIHHRVILEKGALTFLRTINTYTGRYRYTQFYSLSKCQK